MPCAVILTALPVEYSAVRTHLTDLREETHPQGTIYERGRFLGNGQEWEVGIAEVGAGNAGAAVEAERAISHFKPDILFFVGIAGGIKDVAIGDVVAATKVYGYESGKVGEQFFTRPTLGQSAHALVQRARAEARKGEWLRRLSSSPTLQPRVFVAPIAAGEKVIASKESDVFNFVRASYNDAIAVEMEGFGFLSAVFAHPNIKAIVIRGISDLIKDKNADDPVEGTEDERQERASRNASAFTFEILAKLEVSPQMFRESSQEPASSAANSQQRQRLVQRQETLQVEWNLRSEKLKQLRQALAIESGATVKFQLGQQIQDEERQLSQLEEELNSLEQALCASVTESNPKQEDKVPSPAKQRIQSPSPNFFAYDDAWVGRDDLVQELSDRIRGNCRLLILVGITGIGKTALGERLAVEVSDWFENDWSHYHQENFDDEQQTSDFASVAARWLEKWGELITPDDRRDPQRLLYRLTNYLCENRYLIQIDSLENILQGNAKEGWSDFKDELWVKFFEAFLKEGNYQSHIVLTSQDLPRQIRRIGTRSRNFWHCEPLDGLDELERLALFGRTGLDISLTTSSRSYLERIGRAYEGHPLALRVIAGEIKNRPFLGNVLAYWNKYGHEVEEIEKAISEAKEKGVSASGEDEWNLHRYTVELRDHVQERLDKTFSRLQTDAKWAYILLCETSVYRCPVPEDFWLSHLEDWDRNEEEQRIALNVLRDRYLVEELVDENHVLLRQHNLIRGMALAHLKQMDNV